MSASKPSEELTFSRLGLDPRLQAAVEALGFERPTPIQATALPILLEGKDLIGCARTGSGKTAAFGLPLLERVKDGGAVRGLILCPTRELALQVTDALRSFAKKLPVRITTVYGGVPMPPQFRALESGPTIVVGTPGRILDHLERGSLDLSGLEMLVLDEADEMLRMGFIEDVETVLEACPEQKQVALFSATMPDPIRKIAQNYLHEPEQLQVESRALTVDHIEQRWILVDQKDRLAALERVLVAEERGAALVFARTRAGCAELADALAKRGLQVDALHGDLNQSARERVLMRLRAQSLDVVIATDVAARGIDVDHITHVINADLPDDAEVYVHRIGRTGRAGKKGVAISLVPPRHRGRLRGFERALNAKLEQVSVPTDDDIRRRQRNLFVGAVQDASADAPSETMAQLLFELTGESDEGRSVEDIAVAALSLLAKERGLVLDGPVGIPHVGRRQPTERSPRDRERFQRERSAVDEDHVELFFPVGKNHGVSQGNLVGALANGAGIPGSHIGRITLLATKSFVKVARHHGEALLKKGMVFNLRGHDVEVTSADSAPRFNPERQAKPVRADRPHKKEHGFHGERAPRAERGFKTERAPRSEWTPRNERGPSKRQDKRQDIAKAADSDGPRKVRVKRHGKKTEGGFKKGPPKGGMRAPKRR